MQGLKIHILPVGFTPEVFTDATGPLIRIGADKIITLHTKVTEENIKEKVEKTKEEIKNSFRGVAIESIDVENESFIGIVQEYIKLLNRFGGSDQIYVHLGGGERHLGLALIYASFFSNKKITLIPVLEYGIGEKRTFKYEEIPPIKPIELTDTTKKVLGLVMEKDGQTLTEIAKRYSKDSDPVKIAPSIFRHLKNLQDDNLVSFDQAEKSYYPTALSSLFIA